MRIRAIAGGIMGVFIIGVLAIMIAVSGTGFGLPSFGSAVMKAPGIRWGEEDFARYAYFRLLEINAANPLAVQRIAQGDIQPWLAYIQQTAAMDAYIKDQSLTPSS